MRRVAILAYWYPPLNAIGSQRPAKLAKYLPAFGWAPVVVTVDPQCPRFLDPPLRVEPLAAGTILRTRDRSWHAWLSRRARARTAAELDGFAFDTVRASGRIGLRALHAIYQHLVSFPDEVWPWLFDYRAIETLVRDAEVDAIISTSPPATTHLIASRLSRRLGLPWIADLRDPWTQRPTRRRAPPLDRLERRLERRTLARASRLVTVSAPIARDLESLHGRSTVVVPNGFDADDASSDTASNEASSIQAGASLAIAPDRLTLLCTGTLEHGVRDPKTLFAAVDGLVATGEWRADHIEVWIVGRNLEVARRAAAAFPRLAPAVRLHEAVSHTAALAAQRAATILVVLGAVDAAHAGVVTGKVFEYLAARRPILAFAPRGGALDALLAETRGGSVVTTPGEAQTVLRRWAAEWRDTGAVAWPGDAAAVARYDRRVLAGRWATLLDQVTARARNGAGDA